MLVHIQYHINVNISNEDIPNHNKNCNAVCFPSHGYSTVVLILVIYMQIIQEALAILGRMRHRGGCGCDQFSGDGTGIMTAIPHELYKRTLR